jgi:5'-nucleotidase
MIKTLKTWGISVDSAFFLTGIEKRRVLEVLNPHLFFDDQRGHLNSTKIPQVHIPFGTANQSAEQGA